MGRPPLPAPYLVLGAGRAGLAAATALERLAGADAVRVWDAYDGPSTRRRRATLGARGVRVDLGPWRPGWWAPPVPATVVKSPGVPTASEPVRAARAADVPVVDELELGRLVARRELIAVTGTDGKTTVCSLLARALGDGAGPLPVAGNTETGPPLSALAPGGGAAVLEASSYQLEFTGGPFARLAVLTNLTPEHLHRHGSMRAYGAAKRRLFTGAAGAVPRAVVNADRAYGRALAAELRGAGAEVATFGSRAGADYRAVATASTMTGAVVHARVTGAPLELAVRLPGRVNAENVVAALAAGELLGVPRAALLRSLATAPPVPGRWDVVDAGQPFGIVVDFAHTPVALRRLLDTAREILAGQGGGRLHLMLSAGSVMSPAKRRRYGGVAGALADRVVLTEGSYSGIPQSAVIALVAEGARAAGAAPELVGDRRAAIGQAMAGAAPGDLVLLVGRGARTVLTRDPTGGGTPFDDREVAREQVAALGR